MDQAREVPNGAFRDILEFGDPLTKSTDCSFLCFGFPLPAQRGPDLKSPKVQPFSWEKPPEFRPVLTIFWKLRKCKGPSARTPGYLQTFADTVFLGVGRIVDIADYVFLGIHGKTPLDYIFNGWHVGLVESPPHYRNRLNQHHCQHKYCMLPVELYMVELVDQFDNGLSDSPVAISSEPSHRDQNPTRGTPSFMWALLSSFQGQFRGNP